jgi:hypothetical protein
MSQMFFSLSRVVAAVNAGRAGTALPQVDREIVMRRGFTFLIGREQIRVCFFAG